MACNGWWTGKDGEMSGTSGVKWSGAKKASKKKGGCRNGCTTVRLLGPSTVDGCRQPKEC